MEQYIINAAIKKIKEDLVNGSPHGLEELLSKVYRGEAGVCELADFADIKIEFNFKSKENE
ncbi:MAG: hypothetical protein ACRC9P_01860 [Bacteroides sp.]